MNGVEQVSGGPPRRAARPEARLDLYGALGAAAAAAAAYLAALSLNVLPPPGFSVAMFTAAPLLVAVATPIVVVRARSARDEALAWFGAGLLVAVVAMTLQLLSFPAVADHGGPLPTQDTGSAQLYLVFHVAFALGAVAAALRLPARTRSWWTAAGCVASLACALNLVPSPELLRPDLTFTPALVTAEIVLALLLAVAALLWVRQVGRSAHALNVWAGVALSLSCYDVILNAMAAERFSSIWWASLSMRVATGAVLAVGTVASVLSDLRRLERYTDTELDRSDAALRTTAGVTERLLASAEALSRAVTTEDVGRAVVEACVAATGLPRASVIVLDDEARLLHTVASTGYDARSRQVLADYGLDVALPSPRVIRDRTPLFSTSGAALRDDFPALADLPAHDHTERLAMLPLLSAGSPVGLLTVSGDEARDWSTSEREVLTGLAAQAGQALQRAILFERHRSSAELLQHDLLPQRLAEVPGVTLAARYQPGAAGQEVGGDWYDCLPVPGDRLALVVGDVMGKGVMAAIRMGQIRHAIRILASIDPAPLAVVEALDALPGEVEEDQIITLVYLLLDPATGTAQLARVGHLPPVLVSPGQAAVLLEGGDSPPLGVPRATRRQTTLTLPPGSVLVLFTDGLVEDRRTGLEPGVRRLLDASTRLAAECLPPEDLAEALLRELGELQQHRDDTCLLVARLDPDGGPGQPG